MSPVANAVVMVSMVASTAALSAVSLAAWEVVADRNVGITSASINAIFGFISVSLLLIWLSIDLDGAKKCQQEMSGNRKCSALQQEA